MPSPVESGHAPDHVPRHGSTVSPDVERLLRAHLIQPVPPSTPRPSTTVVLFRHGQAVPQLSTGTSWDPQVFVMIRRPDLALAGGHAAFPGGAVEYGDADLPMTGHPGWNAEWATRLGCEQRQAAALAGCAARELFEETGTLLATTQDGPVGTLDVLKQTRVELLAGRTTFAAVLGSLAARVNVDVLLPWSRWVTPAWSPRRYDTLLILAEEPIGTSAAMDGGGEATTAGWHRPDELLDQAASGQVRMLTPTSETLRGLANCGLAQDLWTQRPPLTPHAFTYDVVDGRHVTVNLDGPTGRRPVTCFEM